MRIAVGQLWQETNTFNPVPTTREVFEQFGILRGSELVERMAQVNELGGFIQSLRAWPEQPEIVGLVRLGAWPSGRATVETFEWLCFEFLSALLKAGPLDAVLLALHGAMAAEQHPDVEGEMLTAVRQAVGPRVPIVATLDLHANVTRAMVAAADVLVTYHTMPHVDTYETGVRGAAALRRVLIDGAKPAKAFQKIPAVVPAERSSTEAESGVAVDLKRKLIALEGRPEVLAAGLTPVQPWLDIPEFGASVLVTTDGDESLAQQCCAEIAKEFWRRRREYLPEMTPIAEAVRKAHAEPTGLVVLSDAADATTSGAPGDSVWLLEEVLKYDWPRPALVPLVAPDVIERAKQIGVGGTIRTSLGGVLDRRFGTRIELEATVERLFDARFVMSGHLGKNMPIDMGSSVVLRKGNVFVLITPRTGPHFAPEFFRAGGCEPFSAQLVIAKSPCGFRAVYAAHASAIYSVQAPGCAPTEFWKYPYDQIPHPIWPWDEFGERS